MPSFFDRLFGRRAEPTAAPAPAAPESDFEPLEALDAHIRRQVAGGFDDDDAVLTGAMECFEVEIEAPLLRREASRLLRQAIADHAEAQRHWPAQTDCDRLDAAFAALEEGGVVARQNFTCCGTCGSAEIWDEIDAVRGDGGPARGYAFFHMQDTEGAVEGGGLYLNYGACEDGEAAALAVARDIVAGLEAGGLRTEWDGSWDRRIHVALDWKRRR